MNTPPRRLVSAEAVREAEHEAAIRRQLRAEQDPRRPEPPAVRHDAAAPRLVSATEARERMILSMCR